MRRPPIGSSTCRVPDASTLTTSRPTGRSCAVAHHRPGARDHGVDRAHRGRLRRVLRVDLGRRLPDPARRRLPARVRPRRSRLGFHRPPAPAAAGADRRARRVRRSGCRERSSSRSPATRSPRPDIIGITAGASASAVFIIIVIGGTGYAVSVGAFDRGAAHRDGDLPARLPAGRVVVSARPRRASVSRRCSRRSPPTS